MLWSMWIRFKSVEQEESAHPVMVKIKVMACFFSRVDLKKSLFKGRL